MWAFLITSVSRPIVDRYHLRGAGASVTTHSGSDEQQIGAIEQFG